jgi:hypothetical protein
LWPCVDLLLWYALRPGFQLHVFLAQLWILLCHVILTRLGFALLWPRRLWLVGSYAGQLVLSLSLSWGRLLALRIPLRGDGLLRCLRFRAGLAAS